MNQQMKTKSIFLACLLGISFSAVAQDKAVCEKNVATAIEIAGGRSMENMDALLSPDFTCVGQKGAVAVLVLKQLLGGVSDHKRVSETAGEEKLTLTYTLTSATLGQREMTFVFDASNRLQQADLAGVAVKTMQNEETQVETSAEPFLSVPVQLAPANMLLAQAQINGETKNFIIDSGAPNLILNSRHISSEKTKQPNEATTLSASQGVNGSISNLDMTPISTFDFYGMKIKNQDVLSMDLSHLEASLNTEIHGLIGYQVFKDYDLLFDYENKALVFIRPDHTPDYLKDRYSQSKITKTSIELRGHIPYVQGRIGKQTLTLGIDNGAGENLLNESLWKVLKKQVKALETATLQGAGASKEVRRGHLKELILANKRFQNIFTVFNDMSHLNIGTETPLDGLIGYEILSKQKTLLSFRNKTLLFID